MNVTQNFIAIHLIAVETVQSKPHWWKNSVKNPLTIAGQILSGCSPAICWVKTSQTSSPSVSSLQFTSWQDYRQNIKRLAQYAGGTWLFGLRVIEQQRSDRGHLELQRKHFAALAGEKGKEELGSSQLRSWRGKWEAGLERIIVFILNFTGRITALHCECGCSREEAGGTWPRQNGSVNNLATDAVIVRETLRQADSSLDQIQQVRGRSWDFLSAIQLLSVMNERLWSYSQLPLQISSLYCHYSLRTAEYEAVSYTQMQNYQYLSIGLSNNYFI